MKDDPQTLVHVKKHKRTKFGHIFLLSNNLCQVLFRDASELHIDKNDKMVYYLPQNGQEFAMLTHKEAKETKDPDLLKRLTLTRDAFTGKKSRGGSKSPDKCDRVETGGSTTPDLLRSSLKAKTIGSMVHSPAANLRSILAPFNQ